MSRHLLTVAFLTALCADPAYSQKPSEALGRPVLPSAAIIQDQGDETVISATDWVSVFRATPLAQERGLNYVYRVCVVSSNGGDMAIQNDGTNGTFIATIGRCRDVVVRSELLLRVTNANTSVRVRYRLIAIL